MLTNAIKLDKETPKVMKFNAVNCYRILQLVSTYLYNAFYVT